MYGIFMVAYCLVYIVLFYNHKSPVFKLTNKLSQNMILIIFYINVIVLLFISKSSTAIIDGAVCLLLAIAHMSLKTSTLELVDDMELEF